MSYNSFSAAQGGRVKKYKIVLVGEAGVGKTSLMTRFVNNEFQANHQPTVGVDFMAKTMYHKSEAARLWVWDTAGQERFRAIVPSYVRDASLAIIVYDATSLPSFTKVQYWKDIILHYSRSGTQIPIILVGNKADCVSEIHVPRTQGAETARKHGFVAFTETSAKTGLNVRFVFRAATETLLSDEKIREVGDGQRGGGSDEKGRSAGGGNAVVALWQDAWNCSSRCSC